MLFPSALTHSIASGETKDRLLMINVGDVTEEYLVLATLSPSSSTLISS